MPSWIKAAVEKARELQPKNQVDQEEFNVKSGPPPLFKMIGGPAKAAVKAPQMASRFSLTSRAASLAGIGTKGGKTAKVANVVRRAPKGPISTAAKYTGKNVDLIPRSGSLVGAATGEDPVSKATNAKGIQLTDGGLEYDGPDSPDNWDIPTPDVDVDVPVFGQITTAIYALVALAVIYVLGQLFNVNVG